jgi:type IV pilus assembly protein PilC
MTTTAKKAPAAGSGKRVKRLPRRAETVTLFTRQMATLLSAGLPVVRALETLARQQKTKAARTVITDLAEHVRGGGNFSEALLQYPGIFDHLYVNMVRAGESGGILETVLTRVATFLEKSEAIKKKVRAALVYPLVVIVVAVLIVGFLVTYVIPQFEAIFATLLRGQRLPAVTELVLAISDLVRNQWWLLGGAFLALWALWGGFRRSRGGARLIDRIKLVLPVSGEITRKVAIARFARTFGTLLSSGVPMLEALGISRDVAGNAVVADALNHVGERVRDGDAVAAPLERTGVFPPMVSSMIEVGEQTGQLPAMLERVAIEYEDDVDNAVAGLTSALEPILIVLLAVVVGTIVIALFLPIITIIQNLSG